MPNIKLTIAYDGTHYLGWQKTNMGPSIEGVLENVLCKVLQGPCFLQAASRTDAGVHANGQIVNFVSPHQITRKLESMLISINGLLPKDITVLGIEQADEYFHPTLDCIGKRYHYHLCYGIAQHPHYRDFSWHYPFKQLDIAVIKNAAAMLLGEHDFSSFCNYKMHCNYANHIRVLETLDVIELPEKRLRFEISGNNFLYKMVRNLIGTLVYVGCGKIPLEEIPKILAGKDRCQAGMTAPAHGLCLHSVKYTCRA